jgi:Xaa-Pro aminopeptidase
MTPAETLAGVREAQKAAEVAMEAVIDYVKTSDQPTCEVAHAIIDDVLSQNDCTSPEGHIVSCGPASAEPHEKGTGLISHGVPIVIDIYPRSNSTEHFGDITRTVCLGGPSAELVRMYETVLAAQVLATNMIRPGVLCRDIQNAVETFFFEQGFETSGKGTEFPFAEGFVHGVGHGLGKVLHGTPRITRKTEDVLNVGDIVTVEPGLYYHHIGGVRLEDVVVVTETGSVVVTDFRKQLRIV